MMGLQAIMGMSIGMFVGRTTALIFIWLDWP